MTYIPGGFYRDCDVCGFTYRNWETRKRWDGLMVCEEDWEPQHPQDFVRGRKDQQNVPEPRPEPTMQFVGPLTTKTTAAAVPGATTLNIESSVRFETGDTLLVMMSNGSAARVLVDTIPSTTQITLQTGLPGAVDSGAVVVNQSAVAEADIG
jgi:hypothetical protein